MSGIIYRITNTVNGKFYIGKTTQRMSQRWKGHCYDARHGADTHFARAIRKYGSASFITDILEHTENLNTQEIYWIALLNPHYNSTAGGDGLSNPTTETRRKLSERQLGSKNHFYGRRHTTETKLKMSNANKGRVKSMDEREKLRRAHQGKRASRETKAKMSASRIGRKESETTRERKRQAMLAYWEKRRKHTNTSPVS